MWYLSRVWKESIAHLIQQFETQLKWFVDEQSGLRKARYCLNHIVSLTSMIHKREAKNLSRFAAFNCGYADII